MNKSKFKKINKFNTNNPRLISKLKMKYFIFFFFVFKAFRDAFLVKFKKECF